MARPVERIEQDLAALEEAIATLAREFYTAYFKYLTSLGQTVRQQLILACYQVCTHGYPESFLSLSFNSRQELQMFVKQQGGKAQSELLSHLEPLKHLARTDTTANIEPTTESPPASQEQLQEAIQDQLLKPLEIPTSSDTSQSEELTKTDPIQPEKLVQWQEQAEEAITQTLQTLSLETNHRLQEVGIIPGKLPAAVLEAAAKVEASAEAIPGSPNLLNLLMETEGEGESDDSTLTRIIAINLRLSEIEFADPILSAGRNQIRSLVAKLSKLQREYTKKQRERAAAQAEAAWRASWFDD